MLDLNEIRATILRPRPAPYFGAHVGLRVNDARVGREFLRRLTPHIDSAANWWSARDAWLSVAISYRVWRRSAFLRSHCRVSPKHFARGWQRVPGNCEMKAPTIRRI